MLHVLGAGAWKSQRGADGYAVCREIGASAGGVFERLSFAKRLALFSYLQKEEKEARGLFLSQATPSSC